jgi:hypothetical protein
MIARRRRVGKLRSILTRASLDMDCTLNELTVLSVQIDPYRLDTPAGHRDGQWLARQRDELIGERRIHWRGLHYAIVARGNIRKPNGELYRNDDPDWLWLSNEAGKAARWLGYIDFNSISDNRNSPPIIHRQPRVTPRSLLVQGLKLDLPSADNMGPWPMLIDCEATQRYAFAIFGEKASLEDVLLPIAEAKQADLFLQTGEMSDTLLHQMARDAVEDGRSLVVFTLTDCDPAGRQMSVSIARKLQAFRDLRFPSLRFELVPVALTVEQVRALGLPSTPLKETERRADRWREAFGVEQTEIDALATLQPDTLQRIVEAAFEPYFDSTLVGRVERARRDWQQQARAAIERQIDGQALAALREEAGERLDELQQAIDDINSRLRLLTKRVQLPAVQMPEAIASGAKRHALVSFADGWVKATRALIAHKRYGQNRR